MAGVGQEHAASVPCGESARVPRAVPQRAPAETGLNWSETAYQLGLAGLAQEIVANSTLESFADGSLKLALQREIHELASDLIQSEIRQALEQKLEVSLQLVLKPGATPTRPTPLEAKLERERQDRVAAIEMIRQEHTVKKLARTLSAELDEASVERIEEFHEVAKRLRSAVGEVVVGQQDVVEEVLLCLFAGGHALLEGAPGLGKTLLVRTLSQAMHLDFSRKSVREEQTEALISFVRQLEGQFVIAGNLNSEWSDLDSSLRTLVRELELNIYMPDAPDMGSYKEADGKRLDWILLSPGLAFSGYETRREIVSDHLAVVAEIRLR